MAVASAVTGLVPAADAPAPEVALSAAPAAAGLVRVLAVCAVLSASPRVPSVAGEDGGVDASVFAPDLAGVPGVALLAVGPAGAAIAGCACAAGALAAV
jgi:hypothetical protein